MLSKLKSLSGLIAAKIVLVLALMASLIVAAIVTSYTAFHGIKQEFDTLVTDHVQEMENSAILIARTSTLKDHVTDTLLTANTTELNAEIQAIEPFFDLVAQSIAAFPSQDQAEIAAILEEIRASYGTLSETRITAFELDAAILELVTALEKNGLAAVAQLDAQAQTGMSNLMLQADTSSGELTGQINQLLKVDLKQLIWLQQARTEISLLAGISIAMTSSDDPNLLTSLSGVHAGALRRLGQLQEDIAKMNLIEKYSVPFNTAAEFYSTTNFPTAIDGQATREEAMNNQYAADAALMGAFFKLSKALRDEAASVSGANQAALQELLDVQVGQIISVGELSYHTQSFVAATLSAAMAQTPNSVAAAQKRIDAQAAYLNETMGNNPEETRAALAPLLSAADPKTGIVALRNQALENQTQSNAIAHDVVTHVLAIAGWAEDRGKLALKNVHAADKHLATNIDRAELMMLIIGAISLVVSVGLFGMLWYSVLNPMRRMARRMNRLKDGDLTQGKGRQNLGGEIGLMFQTLDLFRKGLLEKQDLMEEEAKRAVEDEAARVQAAEDERIAKEQQAAIKAKQRAEQKAQEAEQERQKEALRAASEKERAERMEEQNRVMDSLAQSLEALAAGALTTRITTPFPASYEALRVNFNEAVSALDLVVTSIAGTGHTISNDASEISHAADDLSRRTEMSASTLEETSAALDELTDAVKTAAEGTKNANELVTDTSKNARDSHEIVRETIGAMAEIRSSSNEITKIINVIEDIAFQTNLLALNAGVEAARAGDSGRGFAVVATEVRALAQRSSEAAQEIGSLITQSGRQVEHGVDLVDKTGDALEGIVSAVSNVARYMADIAASAEHQSMGISEINAAVNQLDQATQQNAAMFEETTAASHSLNSEASELAKLISQFTTSDDAPAQEAQPDAPQSDAA